jgi:hypothetical protein
VSTELLPPPPGPAAAPTTPKRRPGRRATSLFSAGEAQVWSTGGALVLCVLMIVGLLVLVVVQGGGTFWPSELVEVTTRAGKVHLGEVVEDETYTLDEQALDALPEGLRELAQEAQEAGGGNVRRRMLRTGNFELTGVHYVWVSDFEIASERRPEWALEIERMTWGRFYGTPTGFVVGEEVRTEVDPVDGVPRAVAPRAETFEERAKGPAAAWALFEQHHDEVRERWEERRVLETGATGDVNRRIEAARLASKRAELVLAGLPTLREFVAVVKAELAREAWSEDAARAKGARSTCPSRRPRRRAPSRVPAPRRTRSGASASSRRRCAKNTPWLAPRRSTSARSVGASIGSTPRTRATRWC